MPDPIPAGGGDVNLTPDQVAELGQKIYTEKLKNDLEPAQNGKFVAIDVQSGESFIADTLLEAIQKGRTQHSDRLFHTVRIGYDGVFKMGTYRTKGMSYGW